MARREAYGVYHFAVEIDGIQEAYFRSCSGLTSEAEVVPVQGKVLGVWKGGRRLG